MNRTLTRSRSKPIFHTQTDDLVLVVVFLKCGKAFAVQFLPNAKSVEDVGRGEGHFSFSVPNCFFESEIYRGTAELFALGGCSSSIDRLPSAVPTPPKGRFES